ncbi:MAG: RNA methyltransferase [Nitrospinae bacterium]|nr:RNA methyltransferase [Nitrospinota bacterium]
MQKKKFRTKSSKPFKVKQEYLYGINPVFEALQAKRRKFFTIYTTEQVFKKKNVIFRIAEERNIPVDILDKKEISKLVDREDHQSVIALVSCYTCLNAEKFVERILAAAPAHLPDVLMVDNVQDTNNTAAVLRTSEVLGLNTVILNEVSEGVIRPVISKRSAGAVEYLDIVAPKNSTSILQALKERKYSIYGLDAKGKNSIDDTKFSRPFCIIIGSEAGGVRDKVKKFCTSLVTIPQKGRVNSLNLASAAAIAVFTAMRKY